QYRTVAHCWIPITSDNSLSFLISLLFLLFLLFLHHPFGVLIQRKQLCYNHFTPSGFSIGL
ncbi:MAG TPA: hypothetical protein PLC17_13540, partial [Tenuifilaceae bacterium]|nr:hypothetical protein [Tenuifilaceae bacterium]